MIKNELTKLYNTLYLIGVVKDDNGTNSTIIKNAIEIIDKLQKELNNRIPKKDIQEILDYQYDLWNTPNKQKEYNLELVETLEDLLDKE